MQSQSNISDRPLDGGDPFAEVKPENYNPAEIYPCEYKVLVKVDPVETVSEGGIITSTGDATEREEHAKVRGELIAVGSNAFFDWLSKPKVGERVMIAKFAGSFVEGYDGEQYRLVNDKDIAAVLGRERGGFTRDGIK